MIFFFIFTIKLYKNIEKGQSVQLFGDWVQFPQELSHSKHSKPS
jgi:hypothetical protein